MVVSRLYFGEERRASHESSLGHRDGHGGACVCLCGLGASGRGFVPAAGGQIGGGMMGKGRSGCS